MRKTKVFRKHYCFFLLLICIFGSLFIIKPINVFGEDATDTIISQKEKEDLQRYVYQNELVDPLGGFQYKYPLNLPKGINGIAPTLTLVYNSNVGNGMLGMGWYLHGLPEIKRDFSYGAKYSDQDHFLYNGEKLVKGNDGYYRPQRETFERIRPVNLSSSNSYWEVTLKSGTKLYFGYQASEHGQDTFGRICAANDTSKVYLWSLSKVVDIHGNYYIVEYNQDIVNGDYYPIRITYTQNEQKPLTAVRTVEFSYEPRTDHYAIFNPTKVDQDKRLKWITVKMGTRLLRKYRLDYEYGASSLRSRLIGIQEYGCDGDMPNVPWVDSSYQGTGKTLPMTKFGWQQGNAAYGYSQCFYRTDLPLNKVQYTPGDFNGDGKTDLIVTNASGSVWTLSGGVGTTYQFSQPYARYEMTLGNVQYTPGDFNGDGKTDVIVTLSSGSYWYLSTGMDNAFKPYQAYVRTDFTLGNVQFTPGDFNGDGKTDILVTTGSGTYWYYSTGSGNAYQIYQAYYRPELTYGKVQFTPGDYNGDGKTDIIYTTSAGSYWHISLGTGNSYLAYQSGYRSDLKLGSVQYTPGDYNGDGKTDIIVTTSIGSLWYLSVEDGGPNYQPYYRSDLKLGQIEFNPGDFNGDGKTDLLATSSSGSLWYIFRQKNNACELLSLYFRSDLKPGNVRFTLADLNGDGKSDVILTTASNSLGYITSMNSNLPPDVLTTIKSPQGAKISITYTSAADISGAIISDTRTYPDVANSSSAFLVTKLVFDDGLNHQIADSYNYSNRMIHNGQPYEQANLGFAWVEKQNTCNGASRTYYRQDDLDLRMMIDKVEVRGTDSKVYTEKRYEYQKRANSVYPEVNFIYTAADTTFNYNGESGTPVQYRVEYGYDDYGNINLQKDYGDVDVTGDEKRLETQYNYYIGSTNYLILPAVEQAYGVKLNGQEALAAEIRYYYNTAHLLERREQENGNQDVVTKYGYDSYGNVTSHTDGNGYTTTFVYDDQYQTFLRFKTRKFTEEIRYDDLMRPERKVDANGQIWQTVYDTFSRVKAEIKPGDSTTAPITRISYPDEFVNTSGVIQFPDVMKTERKITDSDYLESYVYQDGFERVIQEKTEAKQGWITIDHLFDNGGRQYSTSVPIYTSTASYTAPASGTKTTTYQFDPIGRITRTTNPDGAYRRTFYGKFDTLTVDELGHVVNHRVVGNIEDDITYTGIYPSQVEYAKTSTISACDGVKRIDAGKNEFVTLHDMLGRTVSSTTPLNGTWSFSYDANGNRITQTDAKKQTISFAYDELDRMYQKTYPNGQTVTYSYDEDGYGYSKGWLTRVVYPKGSESYTYDARGRHSIVTQTIGGLTRTQQFTYNALDQVATQKYPDGEVVNCNYDNGGYLANLKGISTYVDNLEYHPTGKVSKLLYGNGVRTDYDYYDTTSEYDNTSGLSYSFRLRQIRALNTKTGSDLFNLTYEYDKVGNVKVKRDNLNGALTEQYGYDDLDRLTNATSTSYGNKAFRYDMLNNIMEKDTRTYQYEATRPYMVANDGKYGYTYDANGNQNGRSDGRVLTWDYDNRLTAVSDGGINYYRADGQRMAKEEDGVTTYYFFNDYEEEYRAGTKTKTVKYYFANNQRVAENSSVEGIRYYHQDHLGSSSALSDANATLLLRTNYAPYGETITTQGNASVKYRFTGKEQDGTGLYYFGARYYDPMMGRFISVDPIGDGINWYGYCNGNPIKYVDLDGQKTTIYIHSGENIFGHTAINVNGNVYSFGRYNGMYSSSEGSRLPGRLAQFNPSGEGILFSVSEKTYFEDEYFGAKKSNIQEYELKLSKKQEVEVVKYFNNKIKNGTLVELKSGKKSAYKLKTDYNLFTNNCTTITLDSLPNDLQKDIGDYFAPLDLDVNLKVMSKWSEQVKVGKYYEKETTKIKSREDERKKK